jgi:hypothetical protein
MLRVRHGDKGTLDGMADYSSHQFNYIHLEVKFAIDRSKKINDSKSLISLATKK